MMIIITIIPVTWSHWSKHFSQSSFRVHYWAYCFKVSPEEISLSTAHIPVSSKPRFLSGAWLDSANSAKHLKAKLHH